MGATADSARSPVVDPEEHGLELIIQRGRVVFVLVVALTGAAFAAVKWGPVMRRGGQEWQMTRRNA